MVRDGISFDRSASYTTYNEPTKQKTMTITKYKNRPAFVSPFNDLMSGLFSNDIGNFVGRDDIQRTTNAVNITEREDAFELQLLTPGFSKADIKLSVENDMLTISAEKKSAELKENERFTRREFNFNAFTRSFTLPETVNAEAIKAELVNGVLHLELPKNEKAKPRTREISIS